jgi:formylglycine-generating enzyme required for sulfatase activity
MRLLILCSLAALTAIAPARAHGAPTTFQVAGVLPKNSAEQFELAFWNSIKDSKQAGDYEAYLQAYPKGRFAGLARTRIQQLKAGPPQAQAPAPAPVPAPAPAESKPAGKPGQARAAPKPPPARPPDNKIRPVPATGAATGAATGEPPAAGPAGSVATMKDCDVCPVLVALSPRPYTMGSNDSDPSERPAHKVALHAPFAIGKYEVTVGQWNQCVRASVCPAMPSLGNVPDNLPLRDISWDEAQLYLKWLGTVSGKPYRLPTEAEWEYAARGGTATRYWWGNGMKAGQSNCEGCGAPWSAERPSPVGSFPANPYGLNDMNGSVWEWVQDCWHSSYKGAPADGSAWVDGNCQARVIRGGSWRENGSYMLSTTRFKYDASVRQSQNGFRVARSLD